MKVKQVLFFVLVVIAMLGIIMFVFPTEGIRVSKEFTLYFPSFEDMFMPKSEPKINTDSLFKVQSEIEIYEDTIGEEIDIEEIKGKITAFDFPEGSPDVLDKFFKKLSDFGETDRIRILHYGDSQIEGDRITSFIRNKLQSKFGGTGVGLNLPVTIYSQFSILQSDSGNWKRYAGFGYSDTTLKHRKFGPMISFNRYAPLSDSVWEKPESEYSAWIEFNKSHLAYSNTTKFRNIILYYGNSNEQVKLTLKSGGEILDEDFLETGDGLHIYSYSSSEYIDNIRLEFEGYDSPDIYAVSLEDDYGIYVDNIALRGSSGDVFSNSDANLLTQSYANLGVDLFILQFGGNAVPYNNSEKLAKQYANYFKYHISFLKNIVPDACFIVIGPSDMSVKVKDSYETYPQLEYIIDELKAVSLDVGAVYWDCYKAMGGKNSMPVWVNADPPLASADYVHFTPQGTILVSNMFYNALMFEYQSYLKRMKDGK